MPELITELCLVHLVFKQQNSEVSDGFLDDPAVLNRYKQEK